MTRKEITDELKRKGIPYNPTTKTVELEKLLSGCKDAPGAGEGRGEARTGTPPALEFSGGGWCEEAGMSYFRGRYQPMTWAEYEALRQYAENEK